MNSYYEKHREDSEEILIRRNDAPEYPAHFHANVEIFIVKKGGGELILDGKRQKVSQGTVAVIGSYQVHEYCRMQAGETDCCILVVPISLVRYKGGEKEGFGSSLVKDERLCDRLLSIVDEYLLAPNGEEVRRLAVALLWSVLAQKLDLTQEKTQGESALIRQILAFIQENYTGEVTRKKIAKTLGYTEGHISHVFHKYLKVGISEYVNKLRLAHVERGKKASEKCKITELVYEAGFSSLQTYYRVKAKFA